MKNNDINNITLPVFKKLEKFANETNAKLDNVDTSPIYEIPAFTITPKQLETALGITTPITYDTIFFKCKCQGKNYNMAYHKIGNSWVLKGYNASYYIDCSSTGYEEYFTVNQYQLDVEIGKINDIRLVVCENITDLTPNKLGITVGTTADESFLLKDSKGLHLAHFYKSTGGVPAYRQLVVENIYPSTILPFRASFSYELYSASSDTDTFTLSSSNNLYSPNPYTDKDKTLALKSDILTEYRKNKLGNETYTEITTLQGLVDIADDVIISTDRALYIRINQGKYIEFTINDDLTDTSITYNNVEYEYGTDFVDVRVVFEGIETLYSYQENEEVSPTDTARFVGNMDNTYINIFDVSQFIDNIHLYSELSICSMAQIVLRNTVLSDTRLGIKSI